MMMRRRNKRMSRRKRSRIGEGGGEGG